MYFVILTGIRKFSHHLYRGITEIFESLYLR